VTVANGDVWGLASAQALVDGTGCDAVMVGRGALGNPWVFRDILESGPPHPGLREWGEVVLRHMEYQREHFGDSERSAITLRKHLLWYIKGFPGHRELGQRVGLIHSLGEGRRHIEAYLAGMPSDLIRFQGAHRDDARFGRRSKYDPSHDLDRRHDRGACGEDG
jgi:tRNA-dihydrouridine synthase B